jgi:hypothetical protein
MNTLPAMMIMTKEYRAWLKRPTRRHLDDLALEKGFKVRDAHECGESVLLYRDGHPISTGKGKYYQCVFSIEQAMKLINKLIKDT